MNILFITTMSSCNWGGSEELWYSTALFAIEQGNTVIVSSAFEKEIHPKLLDLQSKGAILQLLYPEKKASIITKFFQKITRICYNYSNTPHHYFLYLQAIKKYNPSTILVSQGGTYDVLYKPGFVWALPELKIPYYLLSHFNNEQYNYPYFDLQRIREIVLHAQKSFFISHRNLEVAKRQLAMTEFTNYEVIKNPCKIKDCKSLEMPSFETVCFANIARLHCNTKGQDILLDVLSQKKWKDRNWVLNIYGTGEDAQYLQELVAFYNLENKVFFKGFVDDISNVWSNNHMLVLPSIGEGMPLTIVEAMMCGRPCLVTDVGDNIQLVIDNETGFVAPAPTVKVFDDALERAWQNQNTWQQLGQNAFEKVQLFVEPNAEKILLDKIITHSSQL
jgi:L-malate glycosyltransferase